MKSNVKQLLLGHVPKHCPVGIPVVDLGMKRNAYHVLTRLAVRTFLNLTARQAKITAIYALWSHLLVPHACRANADIYSTKNV